jgi:hypothetical protein
MKTLHITGAAAPAINRDDVVAWIERATFEPAMRAGQPVAEIWKLRSTFRTTVTRVP